VGGGRERKTGKGWNFANKPSLASFPFHKIACSIVFPNLIFPPSLPPSLPPFLPRYAPFYDEDQRRLFAKIKKAQFKFELDTW